MIPELIFDWAKRTPEKTAVIHNGQAGSYRAFAQAIAAARGCLVRRGYVGPGYVMLAVSNLMEFWVFSLALRSLGVTTVAAPSAAAVGMLGLPNVRGVITSPRENWAGLPDICARLGIPLLIATPAGEAPLSLDDFRAPHPPGGHILLTSGTTGIYKMVLMDSRDDAGLLRLHSDVFGVNQHSVLSVFDFGLWVGLTYKWTSCAWSVGGTTLIDQGRKPHQTLLHPGVTHAVLNPTALDAILAAPANAFPRNEKMRLAVGAGAMTSMQIEHTKARVTPHIWNYVASTEAGIITFTPLETPEDHRWHRLVPGRVVEIVDDADRPVPIGEIGRMRVSTAGGPNCYLHDEATTKAFFKDNFFYPGDLAVQRADGRVALQGRMTDVINIRGAKISPAPIESRLSELLRVSAVCLFSKQNDSGEEEVHVVVETSAPIDTDRLILALNKELRDRHLPHVHVVASLPRNPMGKVLRQQVQAQIGTNRSPPEGAPAAP